MQSYAIPAASSAVMARYAYGHPNKEVLQALSHTTVLRTDQMGTIVFHSDGVALSIEVGIVSTADVNYMRR